MFARAMLKRICPRIGELGVDDMDLESGTGGVVAVLFLASIWGPLVSSRELEMGRARW